MQFHPPWSILVAYCLIHRDLNILPESKDVDNFMNFIDLHVHSTCSDGTYTPTQLVEYAAQKGLSAFALTDHDCISGIPEALKAADTLGIELVPGIEFSTVRNGQDIHILGLDIPYKDPVFLKELYRQQQERKDRNRKMIDKMAADGISISWQQMKDRFGDMLWTRAHFARYLAEQGYVKHMWDAFDSYLGDHCKYYVPREKTTPHQIVELIRETGGIPVLAHPFQYHLPEEELIQLIRSLKEKGLLGIEAIYSTHTGTQERELRKLARTFGLAVSGGSDFHGANKPAIDLGRGKGNLKISKEVLEQLRALKTAASN